MPISPCAFAVRRYGLTVSNVCDLLKEEKVKPVLNARTPQSEALEAEIEEKKKRLPSLRGKVAQMRSEPLGVISVQAAPAAPKDGVYQAQARGLRLHCAGRWRSKPIRGADHNARHQRNARLAGYASPRRRRRAERPLRRGIRRREWRAGSGVDKPVLGSFPASRFLRKGILHAAQKQLRRRRKYLVFLPYEIQPNLQRR